MVQNIVFNYVQMHAGWYHRGGMVTLNSPCVQLFSHYLWQAAAPVVATACAAAILAAAAALAIVAAATVAEFAAGFACRHSSGFLRRRVPPVVGEESPLEGHHGFECLDPR